MELLCFQVLVGWEIIAIIIILYSILFTDFFLYVVYYSEILKKKLILQHVVKHPYLLDFHGHHLWLCSQHPIISNKVVMLNW